MNSYLPYWSVHLVHTEYTLVSSEGICHKEFLGDIYFFKIDGEMEIQLKKKLHIISSAENQKAVNAFQPCFVENQKGAIALDFAQQ